MKKLFSLKRLWRTASIVLLLVFVLQIGFVLYPSRQVRADSTCVDGTTSATAAGCSTHGGVKTSTTPPSTTPAADEKSQVTNVAASKACKKKNPFSLSWILCATLEVIDSGLARLRDWIANSLEISPRVYEYSSTDDKGNVSGIKTAWSAFNRLATALIVIAGVLMVLGQAISWGPFDAYTVKKLLPRIIIAAVLMQLSWVLVTLAIQTFNMIGGGVSGLILDNVMGTEATKYHGVKVTEIVNFNQNSTGEQAGIAGSFLLVAATMGTGVLAILPVAIGAIFTFLVAFFILLIRKVIIIMLLIASPIAIAAWAIPGGERFFKEWKEWLFKGLFMYPLIMLLISSGAAMAWVTANMDGKDANPTILSQLTALVFYFAPYFLIPLTFRFAGGLIANISGMVNDRSKGLIDRPKNYLSGLDEQRKKARTLDRNINRYSKLNDENKFRRSVARIQTGTWSSLTAGRLAGASVKAARNRSLEGFKDNVRDNPMDRLRTQMRGAAMNEAMQVESQKLQTGGFDYAEKYKNGEYEYEGREAGKEQDKSAAAEAIAKGKVVTVKIDGKVQGRFDGKNLAVRAAVIDTAAKQGDMSTINKLNDYYKSNLGDSAGREVFQESLARNVGSLINKAPQLYKPVGAVAKDLNAETVIPLHPQSVEPILKFIKDQEKEVVKLRTQATAYRTSGDVTKADQADAAANTTAQAAADSWERVGQSLTQIISDPKQSSRVSFDTFKTFANDTDLRSKFGELSATGRPEYLAALERIDVRSGVILPPDNPAPTPPPRGPLGPPAP